MEIHRISRVRYIATIIWAVFLSVTVVGAMSFLARGSLNLKAALTDTPDLALYLLLPDEEISSEELLRELDDEMHYLVETKDGPKLVKLKRIKDEWTVMELEPLRE